MFFLDSGVLVAAAVKNDIYHRQAAIEFKNFVKQKTRLFTSNYILQETITRIIYNAGIRTAKTFADGFSKLEKDGLVKVIWIDRSLHDLSLEYLYKYRDHPFSFIDASIIAIVKHLKLEKIYTTDSQLRQTGLDVVVLSR